MYNVLYWCHTQAIFPPPNGLGIYKAMGYMPDQFTTLVYYLTYLLECKDVDVFSVAEGSKLSDIFIVDRREIKTRLRLIVLTIVEYVELTTGKKGRRERGRERGRKGGKALRTSLPITFPLWIEF